jgi:hypothetical protein
MSRRLGFLLVVLFILACLPYVYTYTEDWQFDVDEIVIHYQWYYSKDIAAAFLIACLLFLAALRKNRLLAFAAGAIFLSYVVYRTDFVAWISDPATWWIAISKLPGSHLLPGRFNGAHVLAIFCFIGALIVLIRSPNILGLISGFFATGLGILLWYFGFDADAFPPRQQASATYVPQLSAPSSSEQLPFDNEAQLASEHSFPVPRFLDAWNRLIQGGRGTEFRVSHEGPLRLRAPVDGYEIGLLKLGKTSTAGWRVEIKPAMNPQPYVVDLPPGHDGSNIVQWQWITVVRAGSVCLDRFSGLIGGVSAGFRPPRSAAAE